MTEEIAPCPHAFADEIRAFALSEQRNPVPRGTTLFYGSSSIRLWASLGEDIPNVPLLNRGFGGSTLFDCLHEMERLVFPYEPRALILYAGDNDLDQGASPQRVLELFEQFHATFRERAPDTPLAFISIKPSPVREHLVPRVREANALIDASIGTDERTTFVRVFPLMLDGAGRPRRDLFTEDGLHMNRAGYRVWAGLIQPWLAGLAR